MPIDFLTIRNFCRFNHTYDWFKNVQNCIFWPIIHQNFSAAGFRPPHPPLAVIVAIQCEIVIEMSYYAYATGKLNEKPGRVAGNVELKYKGGLTLKLSPGPRLAFGAPDLLSRNFIHTKILLLSNGCPNFMKLVSLKFRSC